MSSMSDQIQNNNNNSNNNNSDNKRNIDSRSQGGDLHIVTESGDQSIVWRSNQLTYIGQDRHELPAVLATKFGHLATKLDLSYNSLTSFKNINLFTNLNELILDNNDLEDEQLDFRLNLRLKTLSLNKNKLTDLYKLINTIKVCYPNLEYLSLIGNPLCPGPVLNFSDEDQRKQHQQQQQEVGCSDLDQLEQQQQQPPPSSCPLIDQDKSASRPTLNNIAIKLANSKLVNDIIVGEPTTAIYNGGIKGIDELILSENAHRASSSSSNVNCGLAGQVSEENATTTCKLPIGNKQQWREQSLKTTTSASNSFSHQKYRHFIIYHLPNLRFLDSSPINASERDDALRRCFWMNRAEVDGTSRDLNSSDTSVERGSGRTVANGYANGVAAGQHAAFTEDINSNHHHQHRSRVTTATNGNQVLRLTIMTDGQSKGSSKEPPPPRPLPLDMSRPNRWLLRNS